jgi:hypothetical protein
VLALPIYLAIGTLVCGGLILARHGNKAPRDERPVSSPYDAQQVSTYTLKYGTPDVVESNENDDPPPAAPTKILRYTKQGVRVSFIGNDDNSSRKYWELIGFQDDNSLHSITEDQFIKRMSIADKH